MSITTKSSKLRVALAAAACCAIPAVAQAKPHRVVILDFDGPQGDTSRAAIVQLLGEDYDVVATKRWTEARQNAETRIHGPAMWLAAARKSRVDAVISGWVQSEGKHFALTVKVVDATSGREVDTIQEKVGEKGLTPEGTRKLQADLEEVFQFIDGDATGGNPNPLPPYTKPGIDGDKKKPPHAKDLDTDEKGDTAKGGDDDADKSKSSRKGRDKDKEIADKDDQDRKDGKDSKDGKDKSSKDDDKSTDAKPPVVAAAAPTDLNVLLSDDVLNTVAIQHKEIHIPHSTPRFAIDAGFFYGTRSFTLTADNPDLIQYPGNPQQGVQISASVYPWPSQKMDGQLQGFGASFSVAHSIGSSVTFTDDDGTNGEYVVQTNSWEAGLHYRWPFEIGAVDAAVTYGNQSLAIEDAPQSLETPDTQYTYIGVGGHVDLKITDRATVGFGGKYMFVTDAGDAVSTDWYGPGSASGISLDADFVIPLPQNLYIRGELKYTRINIDYIGVGGQFDDDGVQSATDTTISASAQVGVNF